MELHRGRIENKLQQTDVIFEISNLKMYENSIVFFLKDLQVKFCRPL